MAVTCLTQKLFFKMGNDVSANDSNVVYHDADEEEQTKWGKLAHCVKPFQGKWLSQVTLRPIMVTNKICRMSKSNDNGKFRNIWRNLII